MRIQIAAALIIAVLPLGLAEGLAADYSGAPRHHRFYGRAAVGDCVRTRVDVIGNPPGTSATPVIRYRDGVVQEFDDGMLGQVETRQGDPIQLCLVSFTRDCGMDDLPGRTYAAGNLRTGAAWTSPDIRSSCAGK